MTLAAAGGAAPDDASDARRRVEEISTPRRENPPEFDVFARSIAADGTGARLA
jgi:hypothetical protein